MASKAHIDSLKRVAAELELLDAHDPEIRCRLCENVFLRLAQAAIFCMPTHDLHSLRAQIEEHVSYRDRHTADHLAHG
jgi:hypothetical protein